VNNYFLDFISPERSVGSGKDPKMNKSQIIDESLRSKTRDSFTSPIHFGKPKLERLASAPVYKIFKSVSAVEACSDGNDINYDEKTNIVTKFAFATRVGYSPNNPFKVNQDAFILAPNILNVQWMHYFGVCDGHGQNGKDVSSMIKQKLPAYLEQYLYSTKLNIRESLSNSFLECNKKLMNNGKFDVHLSGSTWCTCLFYGNHMYWANSGDSRAVIVGKDPESQELIVKATSRDHKPNETDEAKRILKIGGRIEAFQDYDGKPIGPLRVWLKKEDIPGLAMTRSMGDGWAQEAGVIPDAEIFEFILDLTDMYIIIASDGVWEFMDNDMVAKIVAPFYTKGSPEAAANAVGKPTPYYFYSKRSVQNMEKARRSNRWHNMRHHLPATR
jgi:serine/threonine protein phosphatase PrpC